MISVTGPRRVGKTTAVRQTVTRLIDEGLALPDRIVYFTFDDPLVFGSLEVQRVVFDRLVERTGAGPGQGDPGSSSWTRSSACRGGSSTSRNTTTSSIPSASWCPGPRLPPSFGAARRACSGASRAVTFCPSVFGNTRCSSLRRNRSWQDSSTNTGGFAPCCSPETESRWSTTSGRWVAPFRPTCAGSTRRSSPTAARAASPRSGTSPIRCGRWST